MNNSLHRLIDGMVATLRQEIIPNVATEFARGQAFGLIYMLNSIRLRADWAAEFVNQQLAAQRELSMALKPLIEGLGAPEVPDTASVSVVGRALEFIRDDIDGSVCALIEWLGANAARIEPARNAAIETLLRQYMNRQLKWELEHSAKPMFAEMSSGSE